MAWCGRRVTLDSHAPEHDLALECQEREGLLARDQQLDIVEATARNAGNPERDANQLVPWPQVDEVNVEPHIPSDGVRQVDGGRPGDVDPCDRDVVVWREVLGVRYGVAVSIDATG